MIKLIFILIGCFCFAQSKMIAGLKISYDENTTNVDEVSLFFTKSIKNGSMIGKYEIQIKNEKDNFILDIANISFSNYLGELIIGKNKNRNEAIYELVNKFELLKRNSRFDGISYIAPRLYDNISEFDYANKSNIKVFRTIWVKNKLKTSFMYRWKDEKETSAIGLHKSTQTVDFGYTYENNIGINTIHNIGLIYKLGNYHYKSIYVFNSLNKEIFINGVDIFLLRNGESEAKIYLETSYGDIKKGVNIGARFYF